MRKIMVIFFMIMAVFSLLNFIESKVLIEPEKENIIAVAYLQDKEVKAAIANPSGDAKKLKVSYGYYDLGLVRAAVKSVEINPNEILIVSFKKNKVKAKDVAMRLCDTIFINGEGADEKLIALVYVQKLHAAVNYFKCDKFLMVQGHTARILLKLSAQKTAGKCFYVLQNKPQVSGSPKYDAAMNIKPMIGISQLSAKDMESIDMGADYKKNIIQESLAGKIFAGSGYIYLKISVDDSDMPVLAAPRIKEYIFRKEGGVSVGNLTPPQILFHPQGYKIREL